MYIHIKNLKVMLCLLLFRTIKVPNLGTVLENNRNNTVLHHLAKLYVAQGLEARTAYLQRKCYHEWLSTIWKQTSRGMLYEE